jgi:hypothetical protein
MPIYKSNGGTAAFIILDKMFFWIRIPENLSD